MAPDGFLLEDFPLARCFDFIDPRVPWGFAVAALAVGTAAEDDAPEGCELALAPCPDMRRTLVFRPWRSEDALPSSASFSDSEEARLALADDDFRSSLPSPKFEDDDDSARVMLCRALDLARFLRRLVPGERECLIIHRGDIG